MWIVLFWGFSKHWIISHQVFFVQVRAARTYFSYEKYISIAESFALLISLCSECDFSISAFLALRNLSDTRGCQEILEIHIARAGNLVAHLKQKSVPVVSRSEKEEGENVFTMCAFTISQYFFSSHSLYLTQIKNVNNIQSS